MGIHLFVEILIVFILFMIMKDLFKSGINSFIVIIFFLLIFFILGGTMGQLGGIFGVIGKFFHKLPTTEFINYIIKFFKDIVSQIQAQS